jgi:hypothetical protein
LLKLSAISVCRTGSCYIIYSDLAYELHEANSVMRSW